MKAGWRLIGLPEQQKIFQTGPTKPPDASECVFVTHDAQAQQNPVVIKCLGELLYTVSAGCKAEDRRAGFQGQATTVAFKRGIRWRQEIEAEGAEQLK